MLTTYNGVGGSRELEVLAQTEQLIEAWKITKNDEHAVAFSSQFYLAECYHKAGRYQEALQYTKQVVEGQKRDNG